MKRLLPGAAGLIASAAFSAWAFGRLPGQVVTHWGIDGRPDGWSSPLAATVLLPVFGLVLLLIFWAIPRIDPKRGAYGQSTPYWLLANALVLMLAILHVVMLGNALGWAVDMAAIVPVLVGGLFIFIGVLMPRMRPSWFMGIRTPWTLSRDDVWVATHRMGGRFFIAAGLCIAASGLGAGRWWVYTTMAAAFTAVLVPVVYSWWLWRRLEGPGAGG